MKKLLNTRASVISASLLCLSSVQALADTSVQGVGVGAGYGIVSGATLEVNYPINQTFQIRGSLSKGMELSDSKTDGNIAYKAKIDGGINRIALNYHPFQGNLFLSAGYAMSDFALKASGSGTGDVTIGNTVYTNADVTVNGKAKWNSGPTLSFGWGHSPAKGWGAMAEFGVIMTDSPNVKVTASGTYSGGDITSNPDFQKSVDEEEAKLKDDFASANILPIIQAQVTYRF